nr:hypothetical protein [Tanacetum cinerariifolium]
MELDEHVRVHVLEPEHSEYHAPSDDDIQVKDDDEDPEEDPSEEHKPGDDDEDPEEDPNEEHEHEDFDETEPFEEDETALIDVFAAGSSPFLLPPTSPAYDQEPLESSVAAARAPREDVGYVRALQASERRMMTSIKEVNLRVSYQDQVRKQESKCFYTHLHNAQTDCRYIRLEIDVVRGQRNAYETELHEVHQAYLSSEAQNKTLLARPETLENHMSHIKWQHQSDEDLTVTQMMCIHKLEARARTDTMGDAGSSS